MPTHLPRFLRRTLNGSAGLLAAGAIRQWMSTIDCRVAYYDPTADARLAVSDGQKMYIFWHENILLPIYMGGQCNLTMLLSRHRDAEVLSRVAHHMGYELIRGSTYRGATAAVRKLLDPRRRRHLALTPDGPRGPRRRLAPGAIYLASKLGLPLVAMGFGSDRPWRLNSWDRFALPRPFSRGRAIFSPHIRIPPRLDRDDVEYYRLRVERLLNRLTDEAERWATEDLLLPGAVTMLRGRHRGRRGHPPAADILDPADAPVIAEPTLKISDAA